MEYTREELHAMKRADLQKLCKKMGVKANMKTEKLVEELLIVKYSAVNTTKEANEENDLAHTAIPSTNKVPVKKTALEETDETNTKTSKKQKSRNKAKKNVKPSKIPRLDQLKIEGKKIEIKTPTSISNGKTKTPKRNEPKDWSKIHQKQFEKMDSLDVYMSKKRKRAEELGTSGKKAKVLTEEKVNTKVIQRKSHKPVAKPKSVATPKYSEETMKQKRLTFNFLPSKKENTGTVQTPGGGGKRRATVSETHKPATPFRFTSSNSTGMPFGSPTQKMKFDLKASLSKPLRYRPYTGKLQTPPYAKHTPKASAKKTAAKPTHQRDVKAVKTTTRNDRREKQMKTQSKARASAVSRRRGLMN